MKSCLAHPFRLVSQALLTLTLFLIFNDRLWAHAEDERSHQVITFIPDVTGANLHVSIFCGPQLSQTWMRLLDMTSQEPESLSQEFNPITQALLGKLPWVDVKCGRLVSSKENNKEGTQPSPTITPTEKDEHLKEFLKITKNPVLRHHLFKRGDPNQVEGYTWLDLKNQEPFRELDSWIPSSNTIQKSTPKELLLLKYYYRLEWPDHLPSVKGISITIDTLLNVYSSNSIFEWKEEPFLQLIPDHLLLDQKKIKAEDYLNYTPSNEFKLRRGAFYIKDLRTPKGNEPSYSNRAPLASPPL